MAIWNLTDLKICRMSNCGTENPNMTLIIEFDQLFINYSYKMTYDDILSFWCQTRLENSKTWYHG